MHTANAKRLQATTTFAVVPILFYDLTLPCKYSTVLMFIDFRL